MAGFIAVRHGVTRYNIEGRLNGRSDLPLDSSARDSLINTASQISGYEIQRMLVSPMLRARQSAAIIRSLPAFADLEIEVHEGLKELDFRPFEGLSRDQILTSDLAPHYRAWMSLAPDAPSVPGGESWESGVARARTVLELIADDTRVCMVVGHGYMLRLMIVVAIGGLQPQSVWQFPLQSGAWSFMDRQEDIWRLCRHNIIPRPGI